MFHRALAWTWLWPVVASLTLETDYQDCSTQPRALYFLDNNSAGNNIVALQISETDGTLSAPVLTPTGGTGMEFVIAPSQDSVIVSGEYLFAVNTGSNTLSMFWINKCDPTHPVLVGTPATTGFHFALSVTYSDKLNMACALNGGDVAGVTCYSVDRNQGLQTLSPGLFIPATAGQGPFPPLPAPVPIAADIRFNPSSTALFVTVRSDGDKPGLLYSWQIINGKVTETAVVSPLPTVVFAFGLNFLGSDSRLLLTNPHVAAPGIAVLDLSSTGEVTRINPIHVPGENATCWGAYAPELGVTFITNALNNTIAVLDVAKETIAGSFITPTPDGCIDTRVDRSWLYAMTAPFDLATKSLASSPQVLVYDTSPVAIGGLPRFVESLNIFNSVGKIRDMLGMAIYPSHKYT